MNENEIFLKIEYKEIIPDLRRDFLAIREKYLCQSMTKDNIERMNNEFRQLFNYFNLSDLEFYLKKDSENSIIIFEPIRQIDKLAVKGILSLE